MVADPVDENMECYDCGADPSFLVIPIGMKSLKLRPMRACGAHLAKCVRSKVPNKSAIVRVIE